MPYACVNEDNNEVAVVVTMMIDGETLSMCPACFMSWVDMMYQAMFAEDQPIGAELISDPRTGDVSDEDAHVDETPPIQLSDPGPAIPPEQGSEPDGAEASLSVDH